MIPVIASLDPADIAAGPFDDDAFLDRRARRQRFVDIGLERNRLAAAQALADTAAPGVIETLVEFSYAHEGYHGRHAARMLKGIDRQAASALFIETLHDEQSKRFWKVAIEALEELNGSQNSSAAPVVA